MQRVIEKIREGAFVWKTLLPLLLCSKNISLNLWLFSPPPNYFILFSVPSSTLLSSSASVLSLLFISRCALSSIYFYVSSSALSDFLFSLSVCFSFSDHHISSLFCHPSISSTHSLSLPLSYVCVFSFSVTYTYSLTQILFRCSAGTKIDWTVSIVPVSIRFGRVRSSKRQRRICSIVKSRKNVSLESESQILTNRRAKGFQESAREREREREKEKEDFFGSQNCDFLVKGWTHPLSFKRKREWVVGRVLSIYSSDQF